MHAHTCLLCAQFQTLAQGQAMAFEKLQAGVHQVNSDFRTCTNVPMQYWKMRQALKGATVHEVPRVTLMRKQLSNPPRCMVGTREAESRFGQVRGDPSPPTP